MVKKTESGEKKEKKGTITDVSAESAMVEPLVKQVKPATNKKK